MKNKSDESQAEEFTQEDKKSKTDESPARMEVKMIDEPPIGGGGCSFFFDLPERIVDINPPKDPNTGISKYKLPTNYTGVASLSVLTEESGGLGNVTFANFPVPNSAQPAKLVLTLETNSGNKEVILPVDNNGSIATNDRFRNVREETKKGKRRHRLRHPDPDARAIAWKIVDRNNQVVTVNGVRYSGQNDDLYYFYIAMHHP